VTSPRSRALSLALLSLSVVSTVGCPSANNTNGYQPPPPMGGRTGTMPSGTVGITIVSPAAGSPPVGPGTLIDVSAHVAVQDGTDFIDGTSVTVSVREQGSSQVLETGLLVVTNGDLFTGRVSLGGDLASGTYTLTVSARSSGGATNSVSVDFDVDAGPTIIVTSPVEGKSYKKSLTIEVIASDPFGIMTGPTATVALIDVPLTPTGTADTFRGTIDFDTQNPVLFGPQLLTVAMTNNNGRRVEVQVIFLIDNQGPTIRDTHPIPGEIVGGIVPITALIQDNAGVLDSSVIAVIADETGTPLFELPLKPAGAGVYSVLFDSGRFVKCPIPPKTGVCLLYPTISFRASDLVGNERVVGYEFALDNIPPVSDLDSEDVRVLRKDGYCSQAFDPLALNRYSGDMPNDLAIVPQIFDLRARIQDDGNAPAGTKVRPTAGIDPAATSVYILDDTSQPLIVDMDGDGTCDAINPKLIPTTQPPVMNNQVLKVRLAGVKGQGAPDYRADSNPPPSSVCSYPPVALPPEFLCNNGQPFMSITYANGAPAIWSVEDIDDIWCMGRQFDTRANNIAQANPQMANDPNGWACMAVQSADLSGNTGVSPPLRIYIKYDGNGSGPGSRGPGTAPPCTGVYDKATDTVMNGSCTTRRFDTVDFVPER
jgi:hypothetical protein